MDELRSRVSYQKDFKSCNIIGLTETWLEDGTMHVVLGGLSHAASGSYSGFGEVKKEGECVFS